MSNISCRICLKDLIEGAGDLLISHNIEGNPISYGATFDSRAVSQDFVFFALECGKTNGAAYISDALRAGANCIVTSQSIEEIKKILEENEGKSKKGVYFIQVRDTLTALQSMAKHYRAHNLDKAKVVAITGSVGKTSTTQAMGVVLSEFRKTHFPQKNFNNHIGLPITILNSPHEVEILVLEMGMSAPGEIALLSEIAQPDIAIITNIHPVHVVNFGGSTEEIAKAKAEIFMHLRPNGVVILNQDSEHFELIKRMAGEKGIKNILSIGTEKSHLFLSRCELGQCYTTDYEITIRGSGGASSVSGTLNSISDHDAFNSLFVYAVVKLFNLDTNAASQALTKISIQEGRGNLQKVFVDGKKITLINGTYNGSLPSMKDGIIALCRLREIDKANRAICVIGDMLELGDQMGEAIHRELGRFIISNPIDGIITVGDLTRHTVDEVGPDKLIRHFKHSLSLSKKIRSLIQDGDVILLKGSNGMNLSMVVDKLRR